MNIEFHYPHELSELLIDTIPRLCRSKKDVLLFFKGAGVADSLIFDIVTRVLKSPDEITKFEIVRLVVSRINELSEKGLRERREVIKRVTEFEDFSVCWPDDQLKAKGLVSEIRRVVNVKDSFTRMRQERDSEREQHRTIAQAATAEANRRAAEIEAIRDDLAKLFFEANAQKRGKALEAVLNRLFRAYGILIREAFTLKSVSGDGVIEQIDGVVELDGHVYLVEMKWTKESLGPGDVAQHLVRVFGRGHARGLFISASGYTPAALESCRDSLRQSVFALATMQEFVTLLERQVDLVAFLKSKVNAAITHKNPLYEPIAAGEL